jgi:nitrate/nitrite transporter NarK
MDFYILIVLTYRRFGGIIADEVEASRWTLVVLRSAGKIAHVEVLMAFA